MVKYTILVYGEKEVLNDSNQVVDLIYIPPFQLDITDHYEKILAKYKEEESKQLQPKPEDKSIKIE